jgi:hypothetical protein
MRLSHVIGASILFGAVVAGGFPGAADTDEKGFVRLGPDQLQWKNPFGVGVEVAILAGDPTKAGSIYVLRVKFPPGMFSTPHYHPEDRM